MKVFRIIIYALAIVIVALLIVAFFLPSDKTVKSSVYIDAPPTLVFGQVNNLKNWEQWTPFLDTALLDESKYNETKKGVGAKHTWKSTAQGNGTMEITESVPVSFIKTEMTYGKDGSGTGTFDFADSADGTFLTWSYTTHNLKYPMGRLYGIFMKRSVKPVLDRGLQNLKIYTQNMYTALLKKYPDISLVEEKDLPPQPVLMITDSVYESQLQDRLNAMYGEIYVYLNSINREPAGPPFAVYREKSPDQIFPLEAGIPVDKDVTGKGDIKAGFLPGGSVLMLRHFGDYDTEEEHEAIEQYMKLYNLEKKSTPWEVYVTNPAEEKDTTKWETHVIYPLKDNQ